MKGCVMQERLPMTVEMFRILRTLTRGSLWFMFDTVLLSRRIHKKPELRFNKKKFSSKYCITISAHISKKITNLRLEKKEKLESLQNLNCEFDAPFPFGKWASFKMVERNTKLILLLNSKIKCFQIAFILCVQYWCIFLRNYAQKVKDEKKMVS